MKLPNDIKKWGRIKPFFDKTYKFNTLDLETVNNEMFLIGFTKGLTYTYRLNNFYDTFHDFIIDSLQEKRDVLTWTKYDNTHVFKLVLSKIEGEEEKRNVLLNVGKVTPIYSYRYGDFDVDIVNIIKDSMIMKFTDLNGKSRIINIYNLKNLYDTDLVTTAKNYGLSYYSKLGEEYHIIDKDRFYKDEEYKNNVIKSNKLDNVVLKDIAYKMLSDFKEISGVLPKTIYTNGSLARSYLLSYKGVVGSKALNFNSFFSGRLKSLLLDYSMASYHGGKIDSYVIGYIEKAKTIDRVSAYPYAMSILPKMKNVIVHSKVKADIDKYFYAFIYCEIEVKDSDLIHPISVENPINKSNVSPYGTFRAIITKIEYDYMIKNGCKVKVFDFVAIEHDDSEYPYKEMIENLFNMRIMTKLTNPSLSQMFKIILNSLYGITYELTDIYGRDKDDNIVWEGWRAGDFFNSVIASYITAITRTSLSEVANGIVKNGGEVYLIMTDGILYSGDVENYSIFCDSKVLGKFEKPTLVKNVYILGAGRYEYKLEFDNKYVIKNRGFDVKVKNESFYGNLDLSKPVEIEHKTFVTSFKATTKKYSYEKMGYLIDDTYKINPFNLGGKRIILNRNVNLNTEYTKTKPVYLERGII
jgi:hypothetical protein